MAVKRSKAKRRKRKPKPAFSWDVSEPLVNQGAESAMASRALSDYFQMGIGRSLDKLLDSYRVQTESKALPKPPTVRIATLKLWSKKFEWQSRVRGMEKLVHEEEIEKWKARRLKAREDDWVQGESLRAQLMAFLEQLPRFQTSSTVESPDDGSGVKTITRVVKLNTNLRELATAFKVASDVQRRAADLPIDTVAELKGSALDDALSSAIGEYLQALVNAGEADVLVIVEELRALAGAIYGSGN